MLVGRQPSPPSLQSVGGFSFSEVRMSVQDELAWLRYKLQRAQEHAAYLAQRAAP